ncbi:MAG: hypothetical protein AB1611_01355 [bacterium]
MAKELGLRFAVWKWCRWCLVWLVIGVFGFCGRNSWAAADPSRNLSASLWAGYYLPQDINFQRVYSDDGQLAWFVEFSKTWFGQIEAAAGAGGTNFNGYKLRDEGDSSISKAQMSLGAGYIQCSYLFRYTEGQRLVPYFGGGMDAWGYREKKEGDKTIKGDKYGYHGLAGIRFLLDWLDPEAAGSSEQEYGINNTYLVLEARWLKIDNFGENKLDLSGRLYRLGLLWEF